MNNLAIILLLGQKSLEDVLKECRSYYVISLGLRGSVSAEVSHTPMGHFYRHAASEAYTLTIALSSATLSLCASYLSELGTG